MQGSLWFAERECRCIPKGRMPLQGKLTPDEAGKGWRRGVGVGDQGVAVSKPSPITVGKLSDGASFSRKHRIDGQELQNIFTSYCFLFECTFQ